MSSHGHNPNERVPSAAPLPPLARPATLEVNGDDVGLESLYEDQQAWPELVELLLAREAVSAEARASDLSKAAWVFEQRIGDAEGAFLTYVEAVKAAANDHAIANAERLAFEMQRQADLPACFTAAAAAAPTAAAAATAWTALARWQRNHAAWEACAKAATNALTCVPDDEPALGELEEAERQLGRWGDLARTLSRRLALWERQGRTQPEADAGQRAAAASLWADLAGVYEERLGDHEQALAACQAALQIDPARTSVWGRLERLCETTKRDDVAVLVLQHQFDHTAPGPLRTQIALKLSVKWQALGRLEQASTALELALVDDQTSESLYDELAQLYSARGCWHQFIDTCWQHAAVAQDRNVRARLAFEAGRVLQNRLARNDAARAAYTEALTHEPHHLNARRGLVGVHRARGDAESLAEALWELAELSDDREEKIACFSEAATLLRDTLRDSARAQQIEARLLQLDPGNEATLGRNIDEAFAHERWHDVVALIASASRLGAPTPHWVALAGQAHSRLRNLREALAAFHHADALAAPGTAWRVDWVTALVESGQSQQVATLSRQLLAEPALSAQERCLTNMALGHACLLLGNAASALKAFKAALAADPRHVDAMAAIATAYHAMGTLSEAVAWKWTTFDRSPSDEQKVQHALQITAWVRDEAKDLAGAVTVLQHALLHVPTSLTLLHALLDLHTQQQQWPLALSVLSRLAAFSTGVPRAKYLCTAGKIAQHQCNDVPKAIMLFEGALEITPSDDKLAKRIEGLLVASGDAEGHERHLRRRLNRICARGDAQDQEVQVWESLARLYEGPLRSPDKAQVALQVLANLKRSPASLDRLARAYEQADPAGAERAVQIYVNLLAQAENVPQLVAALRSLQRVFSRMGDLLRSLNSSAGLVLVGQATDAETDLVQRAAALPFVPPCASLRESAWFRHIYHNDESRAVSTLLAHVAPCVAQAHARPPKQWGLPARWNGESTPGLHAHAYVIRVQHLAAVIGVDLPALVVNESFDGHSDLIAVSCGRETKMALVLGRRFFETRSDTAFAFVAGRMLARLRPEHLVTWPNLTSGQAELRSILVAAAHVAGRSLSAPSDHQTLVAQYVEHFTTHLSPAARESMAAAARAVPQAADTTTWLRGVALTTNRAGLLMNKDLVTAVGLAAQERLLGNTIGQFEALRDLLCWSATNEFAMFSRYLAGPA
ncbi:MAG: hypothetical protein SF187_06475 [Deltaproteobacteria bacterium]|nr:hypothetical protein [Deltaproteobacteria bacterium]